jgi:hypothetical protein
MEGPAGGKHLPICALTRRHVVHYRTHVFEFTIPRMLPHKKIVLFVGVALILTFAVFAYWLFPVSSLAAPKWEVTVVDEHGKPVEGMTVRETWQNYSVEATGHETDCQTDVSGHAIFPARKTEYSLLSQVAGTLSALSHFNVHASYGPHASVFAFGEHLEGTATTRQYVTDWTGYPSSVQSRIVVRPGP